MKKKKHYVSWESDQGVFARVVLATTEESALEKAKSRTNKGAYGNSNPRSFQIVSKNQALKIATKRSQ